MARKVTPMSVKVAAAAVAAGGGENINVSAVCREERVSRKTFYKWVARFRDEGIDGLQERSRRPHRSPGQIPAEVEDRIVRLRKELLDAGLDHGATTILWHLGEEQAKARRAGRPTVAVPSAASIYRALVRRGVVIPEPAKRPKASLRRFEAPAPNEWWQIDFTQWVTDTDGAVPVFNIIDDHSRVAIASRVTCDATSQTAWETFSRGAARWGLPAGVLSDNGLCFSGKLRGFEVDFEARLRDAGVRPFTGRPYHPQTTGKVERFQQTLKQWLRRQPIADDLAGLQQQLDVFCDIYNTQRPHQGIGRVPPISRWHATPTSGPADGPLAHPHFPSRRHEVTINPAGVATTRHIRAAIHVGVEWAGQTATVITDGHRANVFIDNQLVRHLTLDRSRLYQPSGRRRGGPPRPRIRS